MMLVNIKLDIGGYNMIEFEGYRLHWSSSFLMPQLKQSYQIGILVLWSVCENLHY